MKKIIFILVTILPLLTSCVKQSSKEAYCFTVVFENDGNGTHISMYCKTPKGTDGKEMESVKINFDGKNPKKALKEADIGDYNIFYNSICAYYLSDTLTDEDKKEITLLLLDNAKYKTDNKILYNKDMSDKQIHDLAKDTCDSELIRKTDKDLYMSTLEVLRNIY